jgi:hypothetical protein
MVNAVLSSMLMEIGYIYHRKRLYIIEKKETNKVRRLVNEKAPGVSLYTLRTDKAV